MADSHVDSDAPTTSEAAALAVIVQWSTECPAWQRDALRRLCSTDELDAEDITALLSICKGAAKGVPLAASDVRDPAAGSAVVTLQALYGIKHVNALADGESLSFDKSGVTISRADGEHRARSGGAWCAAAWSRRRSWP